MTHSCNECDYETAKLANLCIHKEEKHKSEKNSVTEETNISLELECSDPLVENASQIEKSDTDKSRNGN